MDSILKKAALMMALGSASLSYGAEVSFLSGIYRSSDYEVGGQDRGKKSEISVGGRFADEFTGKWHWFGQGGLALRSFGKGASGIKPDDSTSLGLGGGLRYYFGKLSENTAAFVYGLGEFRSDKDGSIDAAGRAVTTEKNGLYYGGTFGIRFYLAPGFFCDLEAPLFDSPLFATESVKTKSVAAVPAGNVETVENKTTRMDLFANTTGAFDTVKIAFGLRF